MKQNETCTESFIVSSGIRCAVAAIPSSCPRPPALPALAGGALGRAEGSCGSPEMPAELRLGEAEGKAEGSHASPEKRPKRSCALGRPKGERRGVAPRRRRGQRGAAPEKRPKGAQGSSEGAPGGGERRAAARRRRGPRGAREGGQELWLTRRRGATDERCDSRKEEDRKIRLGEKIMENDKWGL